MNISSIIITTLIFSLTVVVLGLGYTQTAANYNIDTNDYEENQTNPYDRISNISDFAAELGGQQKGGGSTSSGGGSAEDSETGIIRSAYGALKSSWRSITFTKQLIDETGETIYVPSPVMVSIYAIVILIVVFTAISAVFKWKL